MSRPTTRVLAVLELLQAHRQLTGSDLARRLGVEVRTVRRYIQVLEDMGVPVRAERGRDGGYSLVSGFKLPPMMFTDDETLAIALGLVAAGGLGLEDIDAAVVSVRAKLERVMPQALKRRVRAIGETAHLARPSAASPPVRERTFLVLTEAAEAQQRVRLRYRSGRGEISERDVDPYGLVFREGCWYLSGYCHLRRDLRSFRLDRVEALAPLAHSFLRPAGFDAASHLAETLAGLGRVDEGRLTPVEVLLQTDARTAARYIGEVGGVYIPTDAGLLLRTRTDSLVWFASVLARLWFDFEVIDPPELRAAVRDWAHRLLERAAD